MGLWFLFNVLVFGAAGAWTIYAQFGAAGIPTSAAGVFSSAYVLGFFFLLTTLGLLIRQTWARACAVAICVWIAFAPGAIYLGPMVPRGQLFALYLNIFRPLSIHMPGMLIMAVVSLFFALKSMGMYYSAAMDVGYGKPRPALWKTILATLLLGGILCLDLFKVSDGPYGIPAFQASSETNRISAKNNPASSAGARVGSAARGEKSPSGLRVRACRISLDETRLLLVTDDGQGHLVDLRSGHFTTYPSKIETRAWPASFSDPNSNPIGPDADMYFDSDRNMILRFSDSAFHFPIGGGVKQFISFTSSPKQIVVYNREARALQRIEIPIGSVIWSSGVPAEVHSPVFTSPDYSWMTVAAGKNRVLLAGMRDGRPIDITPGYEKLDFVEFTAKAVRLAGHVDNTYSSELVDYATLKPRLGFTLPDEDILTLDDERAIYVNRKGPGQIKNLGGQNAGPELTTEVLRAAVLNPNKYLVAVEENASQLTLVDLDSKIKTGLGRVHEQAFTTEQTCFAVSSTRRIFAVALGDQVEIFWSAFLAADQFRSVVLNLPVK